MMTSSQPQDDDLGGRIRRNVVLAPWTSWLVGGPAEYFAQPENIPDIVRLQSWAQERKLPIQILGGGSNVLISDQGLPGLTIQLRKFSGCEVSTKIESEIAKNENGKTLNILCLSGTNKSEILKIFLQHRLRPALFLAGLPGDVGGGIVMNAGIAEAMTPREFGEIVEWFEVLKPDGTIQRYSSSKKPSNKSSKRPTEESMEWHYRHSRGWQPGIILRAQLRWSLEDADPAILDKVREANRLRLQKQPLDLPSCGSVFKNPPQLKAAQLIDSCGLKGFQIGAAQVSPKHANFIVNLGQARAQDIWALIEHVRSVVQKEKGVTLNTEVLRMGEWRSNDKSNPESNPEFK